MQAYLTMGVEKATERMAKTKEIILILLFHDQQ